MCQYIKSLNSPFVQFRCRRWTQLGKSEIFCSFWRTVFIITFTGFYNCRLLQSSGSCSKALCDYPPESCRSSEGLEEVLRIESEFLKIIIFRRKYCEGDSIIHIWRTHSRNRFRLCIFSTEPNWNMSIYSCSKITWVRGSVSKWCGRYYRFGFTHY